MTNAPAKRKSEKSAFGRTDRAHDKPKVLTDAAIKKYKPEKERRRIRDLGSQGLFLIIEPSGTKSFEMRFRRPADGRPAKIRLGRYTKHEIEGAPVLGQRMLTLAAARQLAQEVHRRRALGEDVIGEHKAQQQRQRAEVAERDANTYPAAARAFVEEYARPKTRRWLETAHWLGFDLDDNDTLTAIPGGLAQLWADKPVGAIDASDIWNVIEQARRTAVPGIKPRSPGLSETRPRSLLAMLSRLFGWLHRHRRIAHNPCAGLHRPPAPAARDRVLTSDEVRWFWAATEAVDAPKTTGAPKPFKPLLRLLLLTGARLNEVAGMRRDELHADGTWHLPGERTKNKRPHVVALSPLARDLIATMRDKGSDFVFTTNGQTPVSGWNRMKRRLDAIMLALAKKEKGSRATIPAWRIHDLRRTAVTGMAELGIRPDVIELAINHVSGHRGGIAGVYNRSELWNERREALEQWSRHVQVLVSNNVVRLPRHGGAA